MQAKGRILLHAINLVFLTGLGSFLHFAYELSGKQIFVAPFAALDESVWEHGKLLFWPAVLLALIFATAGRVSSRRLAQGVASGTAAAITLMIGGFYGYTALLGYNLLALDLSLFVISVVSGYALGWYAFQSTFAARNPVPGFLLLAALAVSFCAFSFWKPPIEMFHESAET